MTVPTIVQRLTNIENMMCTSFESEFPIRGYTKPPFSPTLRDKYLEATIFFNHLPSIRLREFDLDGEIPHDIIIHYLT